MGLIKKINKPKVLIYDDENIAYVVGDFATLYNKEVEVKRLDNTIKEKQNKIKELDDILQDKEGRVKKLKEFVANIYNTDLDEDNEDYDWD